MYAVDLHSVIRNDTFFDTDLFKFLFLLITLTNETKFTGSV